MRDDLGDVASTSPATHQVMHSWRSAIRKASEPTLYIVAMVVLVVVGVGWGVAEERDEDDE